MRTRIPLTIKAIFFTLFLTIISCADKTVYHSYHPTPANGWSRGDTLVYPIYLPDSLSHYKISIEIRNNDHYPYSILSLGIRHNLPDTAIFQTDSLSYSLADSLGRWVNRSWGTLYQTTHFYQRVFVEHSGNYELEIYHTMYSDTLKGINDIGVHIEKE